MRRIYDLRRYGLPETLLDIWVQQQGEFLLPVQEAAVQRYGLFEGRSLLISSPTSSGKTFVGEMAAMRAVFAGKRVLYLTHCARWLRNSITGSTRATAPTA